MALAVGKKESSSLLEACNSRSSKKNFSDDGELIPSNSSSCIDGQCAGGETSNILTGCSSNESKPTIFHKNRDSSNQCEKHDLLDSSVDDLSCIVRSDNGDMAIDNSGVNNKRKDASSNSSSVNNFLFTEKTPHDQVNEHCEISRHSEMLQSKKNISDCLYPAALPNQSDPSEISSLRNFSTKGEASICTEEKGGLSCNKTMINRVRVHLQHSDSSERSDGNTICQQEVTVTAIDSASEEHKEKSYAVHGGPSREELPLPTCAPGKDDASEASNDEVRVCDICGDVGREHMLAVCSKCSDGAEHIYCMWVKMDKVPNGNWICEECAAQEKAEKKMKNIVGRAEKCQKESSLKTMTKKDKGLGNSVETSELGIQKRKINKVVKSPDKSGPIAVGKRKFKLFAKSSSFPASSHKKLIRQHISIEDVDEGKLKHQVTCTNQVSLNTSSKGLLRSKSFHIRDKNVNENHPLEFGGPKPDIETNGRKNEANGRTICKSNPLNGSSSPSCAKGQSNVEDKKVGALRERKSNPMLCSCKARVHATTGEKRTIMPCQLDLPLVSNKHENGKVRGHNGPNKLLKSMSDLSQSGLNLAAKHYGVLGDVRQHFGNSEEEKSAAKGNNLKFVLGFQMPISQVTFPSGKLVVPQPDFSWKGEFEVVRIGGVSSSFSGFQAHLSNSASPKVLDVVKKFPQKLMLKEVSRLSTWPAQFTGKNAVEQDIALFFFAEDPESYERNYRILSDTMVKEDLALEGCIDGVEMLIFFSDILPEGSHRWNGLSYLWCVFRNQTVNSHEDKPNSLCSIPEHATKHCLFAQPQPMNGDEYSPGQSSAPRTSCDEEQNSNSSSSKTSLHASFMGSNKDNPSVSSSKMKVSPPHVKNQDSSVISASMSTEQLFNGSVFDNNFLVDGKDSSKIPIWELNLHGPAAKKNHDSGAYMNLFSGTNMSHGFVGAKHSTETSINVNPSFSLSGRGVKTTDYIKADHEERFAPGALDLELSLGCGKKSGRMLREEMVTDRNGKEKHHESMTNNDDVSTGLALTLAPPIAR